MATTHTGCPGCDACSHLHGGSAAVNDGRSSSSGRSTPGLPPAAEVPLPSLTQSHLVATNAGQLAIGSLSFWRLACAFGKTLLVHRQLCGQVVAAALVRHSAYSAAAESLQAAAAATKLDCSTYIGYVESVGQLLQWAIEDDNLDLDLVPGAPLAVCTGAGSSMRLDGTW
jgi:hypothetical protein